MKKLIIALIVVLLLALSAGYVFAWDAPDPPGTNSAPVITGWDAPDPPAAPILTGWDAPDPPTLAPII